MLCNDNELRVTGATVCGQTFRPCGDDESYAVFRLENCSCGVLARAGESKPYLRILPGVQIPPEARAGFERFLFECDDDEMVDLEIDRDDGEVFMRRDLRSLEPDEVERVAGPALAWVDRVAFPAVAAYIADVCRGTGA